MWAILPGAVFLSLAYTLKSLEEIFKCHALAVPQIEYTAISGGEVQA